MHSLIYHCRMVDIFPDLVKVMPAESIATSFSELIDRIPKRDSEFGAVKLRCLSKVIDSPLFNEDSKWLT